VVEPPPLLLLPPPQPTPAAKNTSNMTPSPATRRRRRAGTPRKNIPTKHALVLAVSQPKPGPELGLKAPEMVWPAEVLRVRVEVPEALATDVKLNPQAGAGVPPPVTLEQASVTAPLKPPVGAMVMVEVDDPPAATVAGEAGPAVIVKSGADRVKLTLVL
jgi:hypothetical protein